MRRETIAYTCCDKKEKAVHSIAAFHRKTTANSTKFQNHAECLENFFLFRPRRLISIKQQNYLFFFGLILAEKNC